MTKLTLSMDEEVIRMAKEQAHSRGLSVSQMVAEFFLSLKSSERPPDEVPPVLGKLTGILDRKNQLIKGYHEYIERKYS